MNKEQYHAKRRERFNLLKQLSSSNDIGYSQEEASAIRYYISEIDSMIRPPFDYKEDAVRWRLARLQNELRYYVRFGRKIKKYNASIWP